MIPKTKGIGREFGGRINCYHGRRGLPMVTSRFSRGFIGRCRIIKWMRETETSETMIHEGRYGMYWLLAVKMQFEWAGEKEPALENPEIQVLIFSSLFMFCTTQRDIN
jgi:hypothetical protein